MTLSVQCRQTLLPTSRPSQKHRFDVGRIHNHGATQRRRTRGLQWHATIRRYTERWITSGLEEQAPSRGGAQTKTSQHDAEAEQAAAAAVARLSRKGEDIAQKPERRWKEVRGAKYSHSGCVGRGDRPRNGRVRGGAREYYAELVKQNHSFSSLATVHALTISILNLLA
ncbi:hypothetical protein OF83DRAFT_1180612 [Amylostereum chailletii]|nr:hypothetical protein OF83DRAFT_1180612 [Amylostereum chailletii]